MHPVTTSLIDQSVCKKVTNTAAQVPESVDFGGLTMEWVWPCGRKKSCSISKSLGCEKVFVASLRSFTECKCNACRVQNGLSSGLKFDQLLLGVGQQNLTMPIGVASIFGDQNMVIPCSPCTP